MFWEPFVRKMRSSAVFSAWMPEVSALCATDFDFAPLLSHAVAAKGDEQEDHEPEDDFDEPLNLDDPLNQVDTEWPPADPWNDVDDLPPPPPARKRRASATYDDLIATGAPLTGPHRRRAAKRARTIETEGYEPRESTIRDHVRPAAPVVAPSFDASTLPVAHGAYGAKVEDKAEKYGSKKRRTVAELIGLGFQLIPWNGVTARPLVDGTGRIFAVLAGQPDNEEYRAAIARAYAFIKAEGIAAQFPASMRHHRRGLFAAINLGLNIGKGQLVPSWLDNKEYTDLSRRLLTNKDIIRMANFASSAFRLWAPRLHGYYVDYNK
ncbi:hypothetical protein C8R44DRAFT_719715 [Mycena epipterygia]|nr:hypothetical protein C8R44DRAFT_719715 [Mycena epipterygia]